MEHPAGLRQTGSRVAKDHASYLGINRSLTEVYEVNDHGPSTYLDLC